MCSFCELTKTTVFTPMALTTVDQCCVAHRQYTRLMNDMALLSNDSLHCSPKPLHCATPSLHCSTVSLKRSTITLHCLTISFRGRSGRQYPFTVLNVIPPLFDDTPWLFNDIPSESNDTPSLLNDISSMFNGVPSLFNDILSLSNRIPSRLSNGILSRAPGYYAGLLSSAFMIGHCCPAHYWGVISDRHGTRFVVVFGLVSTVVLSPSFGFSTTFTEAFISRCVDLNRVLRPAHRCVLYEQQLVVFDDA